MSVGYTTMALRREIRQNVEPAWGLSINNIANPELVDNRGEMHDCYVAPGTRLSVGEGAVVVGSRLLGDTISIGRNCKVVNVELLDNVTIGDDCEITNSVVWCTNGLGEAESDRKVVFGNDCHIHDTVFETYAGSGLSLVFGDRAYLKVGSFKLHGNEARFGDDCSIMARTLEIENSLYAGNGLCIAVEAGSLAYQGRLKLSGGSAIRIGSDVKILGSMTIRASKRFVLGDRTLLNSPTGYNKTLMLVELRTGTEAVVIVDCDFPRYRSASGKIRVGSRGRLELTDWYTMDSRVCAEEVSVASNDSLSIGM